VAHHLRSETRPGCSCSSHVLFDSPKKPSCFRCTNVPQSRRCTGPATWLRWRSWGFSFRGPPQKRSNPRLQAPVHGRYRNQRQPIILAIVSVLSSPSLPLATQQAPSPNPAKQRNATEAVRWISLGLVGLLTLIREMRGIRSRKWRRPGYLDYLSLPTSSAPQTPSVGTDPEIAHACLNETQYRPERAARYPPIKPSRQSQFPTTCHGLPTHMNMALD
jgi:hypothetical protein